MADSPLAAAIFLTTSLAGCSGAAAPAATTPSDDGTVGNTSSELADEIEPQLTRAAFHALLGSAALRSISLEQTDFDPIGDVEPGRIMSAGDGAITVEDCGWPSVEFYVDRDDNVYAVPAGNTGDVEVTEYQKRKAPRCGRYRYELPAGLVFAFRIELEDAPDGELDGELGG